MIQNIITLGIVLAAAAYTIFQIVRIFTAPSGKSGCSSCGISGSCTSLRDNKNRRIPIGRPGEVRRLF